MTIGQVIRHLRQSKRLSQAEFAELVYISASYLSQLEGDKRAPTIPLLRKMATVFGAPAVLLFAAALAGDPQTPANDLIQEAVKRLIEAVGANLRQQEFSFPPDQ